jgi:phage regulator Rha-like protein
MNDIPQVQELVMFDGERLVTDSRMLATTFNRSHKKVLRACDYLKCDKFSRLNFEAAEDIEEQGKRTVAWR